MPDTLSVPQPNHPLPMLGSKEYPGRQMTTKSATAFPEYLKHTNVLEENGNRVKFTAANSLFHAVLKGRVRNTEKLLDRGTAVNGRNDYGFSVLTAALHIDDTKRRDKMFRLLLERGADPHFKDGNYDRTVLHWACVLGRTEQVEVLLSETAADIDLQEKDQDNYTALHCAVMAGHLPVVMLLVDIHRKFGVTVDVADSLGLTPYLHAKRLGYREVAQYLHSEGLASQGHGDIMFRTPREWSQIGKFERQKAMEIHTQDAINTAKIQGRIRQLRSLEDTMTSSPRTTIPSVLMPAYSTAQNPRVRLAARHADRLSTSLPSLQPSGGGRVPHGLRRPISANGDTGGGGGDFVDAETSKVHAASRAIPRSPREAFVNEAVPTLAMDRGSRQTLVPIGPPGSTDPGGRWEKLGLRAGLELGTELLHPLHPLPAIRGPKAAAAFTLMEMNKKGRHASTYRQSQFDETKASEYQHILGNLNSIMDMLSQQQSKSFRKSVKYQRPETPKKPKAKDKVSSLAVIFGRNKGGGRSRRRSARPPRKKESASSKKKEKEGGEEKRTRASGKKKTVPVLKLNGSAI